MFLPANIDLSESDKYNLSIRLETDGFSFLLNHSELPKLSFFQRIKFDKRMSYLENLKKYFFDFSFLTLKYVRINIVTASIHYTIVPRDIDDEVDQKEIFSFLFSNPKEKILSDEIDELSVRLLYDVDKEMYDFILRTLWEPVFSHHMSLLIKNCRQYLERSEEKKDEALFINLYDLTMDVILFRDDRFQMARSFETDSMDELLYFFSSSWNTLGLDQLTTPLLFISNFDEGNNQEFVQKLSKYIKNIEFINLDTQENKNMNNLPTDFRLL